MIIRVTKSIFHDAFHEANRADEFSYEAREILFDMFDDCGDENQELDVTAICCDYSEEPLEDVLKNYNLESFEELQDNTYAVMTDDETVLYQIY